jgi:type VI secretion system Hcp family effector
MRFNRLLTLILLAFPLALLAPGTAFAQWGGYLLIDDGNGDPIEGPSFTPDPVPIPDAMLVYEFHHLVTTDEGTTAPYQKPFVVKKRLDRTSSRLFQAFAQEEHLTVTLKIYEWDQLKFEFELVHARIVAIEPITETTDSGETYEYEKIRFMFEQITVRDIAGGTSVVWQLAGWPS